MNPARYYFAATLLAALVGCDSESERREKIAEEVRGTWVASTLNYTAYDIAQVYYDDAQAPWDISKAGIAGSVYLRNSSTGTLDDGTEYSYFPRGCCVPSRMKRAGRVRVVWQVVTSLSRFEGEESSGYRNETRRDTQPGSVWCMAEVDVRKPKPVAEPDTFMLHFLADGTVVASHGDIDGQPLSAAEAHRPRRSDSDDVCANVIKNPLFGQKPRRHVE